MNNHLWSSAPFLCLKTEPLFLYLQVLFIFYILKSTYIHIIRFLQSSPESTDTPFKFRKADRYLSLEDFRNFEVNYVYSGSYTQFFLEEQKTFHKGDLVIIAPDSPHYVLADHQSLILCINIRKSTFNQTFWQLLENNDILSTFFKQMMYGNHTSNYLSFSIQTPEIYEPLLQQIYDETVADDEYGNYMAINLLNTFLFSCCGISAIPSTFTIWMRHSILTETFR